MRRTKLLDIMLIVLLFVLFSCSDKSTAPDDNNSGFPHVGYISNWVWPGVGINTALIIMQGENEREPYVDIAILIFDEAPNTCELKLDDNTVLFTDLSNFSEYWYVDSYQGYTGYFLYADNDDFPQLNSIFEGQTLDYYLKINDTINSGSLTIPYQPSMSFPYFDVTLDYNFEWTILESPDIYYVFFEIDDSSYDPIVYDSWQVPGDNREYTIPNSLYQEFAGEQLDIGCLIHTINYSRDDTFLAFSYKWDFFNQGFDEDTLFNRKLSKKKLLKAFIEKLDYEKRRRKDEN